MASPRLTATPASATVRPISITPGSRILDVSATSINGRSPLSDEGIWKRLKEVGFDEDSIRRRDKAALIAYIAKLEAEIYELQYNMGLLIMEKKDYTSKYEEATLSAESVEVKHMRELAALSAALAEARKREENLKKALGVEKECVANIEKALHELRTECAEVKVAAEIKMAEARSMVEDAQKKFWDAEVKLRSAESLIDEAKRSERSAARKLQEVEAREDDLHRRMASFKTDCDAKEKEIMLERQSLVERKKVLSETQNKVLDSQALLNQREADIIDRSQALKRIEKELEDQKENIAAEWKTLMEQKSEVELNAVSLSERERAVIEKEVLLSKKEQEFLISQEKITSKEHNEVQKLVAEQESALRRRKDEFEAELAMKQKLAEKDIESKRRAWELKELDLKQREDSILEKEQDLEVQQRVIADKGKDLAEQLKAVKGKESLLFKSENEVEQMRNILQKEREELDKEKIELEKSLLHLEEEKNVVADAQKRLELMKSESNELLLLEMKLKEEIDSIRAQKLQLEDDAEKLKVEKAKFEIEWEVLDEKREELQREEERIAGEKLAISKFLKDERDSITLEKESLREQYRQDVESLSRDREAFRSESQREHSEWFAKFQQERADFLLEIECRKRELEDCINKKREDVESYLKEKEKAFEEEKTRELKHISSLKDDLVKEQEQVAMALKKLQVEKLEIKLDREQRDKAWAELQNLIEELQMQRVKLKEQRELLHADREEIYSQIEKLKTLEDIKDDTNGIVVPVTKQACAESTPEVLIRIPSLEPTQKTPTAEPEQITASGSPPTSVSWLKKCASLIFKPDRVPLKHTEPSLNLDYDVGKGSVENEHMNVDGKLRSDQEICKEQAVGIATEEPKVIHEVPLINDDSTELEAAKDVHESPAATSVSAGRKRRVDDSPVLVTDDVLLKDGKSNKKRRQENADTPDVSQSVDAQYCVDFQPPSGLSDQCIISVSKSVGQSEINKTGTVEGEAYRCVVSKQTTIEEVLIVEDVGNTERPHEKEGDEGATESKESEKENVASAEVDLPEIKEERVKTRSRSKQKL